ncbi:MAG: YtxH domain-containing protein [Miniphocaeibacter sp.]|uniref:YtxH domain-containing protein n=1 Tax=Miniphocaeibacter sp. TaxID=3100973 RepID=UPI0017B0BD55|nr:general stress protein [Gallicola sp.]
MSLSDYLEAKRRERERRIKNELRVKQIDNAKRFAIGTVAGTLIGVAAGVLFAPKSGEETRQDIADLAKDTSDQVKEGIHVAKDNIVQKTEEITGDIKDKYAEFKDRGYTEIERVQDLTEDLVEVAKDAKDEAKEVIVEAKDDAEKVAEDTKEKARDAVEKNKKKEDK